MDETRIKQAEKNIPIYLEDGLLSKVMVHNKNIQNIYERNSKESIEAAENIQSNLWVIVCSYYAMFYITNAVLYKLGYKTGQKVVHKVTSDCLIVYVRKKLQKNLLKEYEEAKQEALDITKADEIISSYDKELDKRSVFQYGTTEEIKKAKAETSLKRAKLFVAEMRKLL